MIDALSESRAPSPESQILLENEAATIAFGRRLAEALPAAGRFAVALTGPLGAGKSTLARAALRALGVNGAIPSPTYTLVEPYVSARGPAYHIDLYRLQAEETVETLGLDATIEDDALLLVEWPERGDAGTFAFDLAIALRHAGERRALDAEALSTAGAEVLARLRGGA